MECFPATGTPLANGDLMHDNFKQFVISHDCKDLLSEEEYLQYSEDVSGEQPGANGIIKELPQHHDMQGFLMFYFLYLPLSFCHVHG